MSLRSNRPGLIDLQGRPLIPAARMPAYVPPPQPVYHLSGCDVVVRPIGDAVTPLVVSELGPDE